jgi:predicted nucleotidyltransferase
MTPKVGQVLAELHARLKELYGERLVRLVLFGSQARGDAGPDSDIDVVVVLRGEVDPFKEIERGGHVTAAVSLDHGVTISAIYVSQARYEREAGALLTNVRAEGVTV